MAVDSRTRTAATTTAGPLGSFWLALTWFAIAAVFLALAVREGGALSWLVVVLGAGLGTRQYVRWHRWRR